MASHHRTRRAITFLAVLSFATTLHAFRPRPISDLRFENPRAFLYYTSTATDGNDFFVVWNDWNATPEKIWGQRITREGRTTPLTLIGYGPSKGAGAAPSVLWTGSKYLVAWKENDRILVTGVSRQGLPTSTEPVAVLPATYFATLRIVSNGKTALVATWGYDGDGGLRVDTRLLDLDGGSLGPVRTIRVPAYTAVELAGAGDGYVIAFASPGEITARFLGSDGAVPGQPVILDGPYAAGGMQGQSVAIATDGTDLLVVFSKGTSTLAPSEIKSVVLDVYGSAKGSTRTLVTNALQSWVTGLFRHGSTYVAALQIKTQPDPPGSNDQLSDPALMRLGRAGEPVGPVTYLPIGRERLLSTTSNGRDLFVVWNDRTYPASRAFGAFFSDNFTAMNGPPARLGRMLDRQSLVTVVARGGETVVAWVEVANESETLRFSRLDAEGNYLDGEGIVVAGPTDYLYSVAVDRSGAEWVVAWSDSWNTWVSRISRAGRVIDAPPLRVGNGRGALLRCNGGRCLIVMIDYGLRTAVFGPGAKVTQSGELRVTEAESGSFFFLSDVVATNDGYLIAFLIAKDFHGPFGSYYRRTRVAVARVDAEGHQQGASVLVLSPNDAGEPSVASDGRQFLVAWGETTGVWVALLPANSLQSGGLPFLVAKDGDSPSVAFDGNRFIMAWRRWSDGAIATAPLTPFGAFPVTVMPLDPGQYTDWQFMMSADERTAPVIAFSHRHEAYDGAQRGGVIRLTDLVSSPGAPAAPSGVEAARIDGDTIDVHWQSVERALGVGIELRLMGGGYRLIAVAPAGATSAVVKAEGFHGTAIRLRAWNGEGTSDPSADALIGSRSRAVRAR